MTNTKARAFDPYEDLKWFKEIFVHNDSVVGERYRLKCRTPGERDFYSVGEAKTETFFIDDLENLEHYSDVVMRPGVKERIEEINEEDND